MRWTCFEAFIWFLPPTKANNGERCQSLWLLPVSLLVKICQDPQHQASDPGHHWSAAPSCMSMVLESGLVLHTCFSPVHANWSLEWISISFTHIGSLTHSIKTPIHQRWSKVFWFHSTQRVTQGALRVASLLWNSFPQISLSIRSTNFTMILMPAKHCLVLSVYAFSWIVSQDA